MKPFKLRICGQPTPVSPDDFADIEDERERELRMGEWCPFSDEMRLNIKLQGSAWWDALFHEVMEKGNAVLDMNIPHANRQRIGQFWLQFIRDNPRLIKKLLAND